MISRSKIRLFVGSILALALLAIFQSGVVFAGLINVNLTDTTTTGIGNDGSGPLGSGAWNRVNDAQAAFTNQLITSANLATGITMTQSAGPAAGGNSQGNGNLIQNESWGGASAITLSFSGLLPNQVYKVAVYSDRIGSGNPTDSYTVNGVVKPLPNPGAPSTTLPGTVDVDYALFTVQSTAGGVVTVSAPFLAGVQIQGVLPTESGPQADCLITKSSSSTTGKGGNTYSVKPTSTQTLSQKAGSGGRRTYYVNVQSDGAEIDNFFLMGFWKNQGLKLSVIDKVTSGNVTAQAKARKYRFNLEAGATRGFKVNLKRAKATTTLPQSAQICASPSTLKSSQQDCVTCTLTP